MAKAQLGRWLDELFIWHIEEELSDFGRLVQTVECFLFVGDIRLAIAHLSMWNCNQFFFLSASISTKAVSIFSISLAACPHVWLKLMVENTLLNCRLAWWMSENLDRNPVFKFNLSFFFLMCDTTGLFVWFDWIDVFYWRRWQLAHFCPTCTIIQSLQYNISEQFCRIKKRLGSSLHIAGSSKK